MSRIHAPATSRMQSIARNPAVIALFMTLALAGCASKKNLPNSAGELGLNNATPGSQQDFTGNVGDRIFFDTDSSSVRTTRSPSKAMPTNAARANTTLRSARAARRRPGSISPVAAFRPTA